MDHNIDYVNLGSVPLFSLMQKKQYNETFVLSRLGIDTMQILNIFKKGKGRVTQLNTIATLWHPSSMVTIAIGLTMSI